MRTKSKARKDSSEARNQTPAPENAGENAAVNDPNIDAKGEKVGKAGQQRPKADPSEKRDSPEAC